MEKTYIYIYICAYLGLGPCRVYRLTQGVYRGFENQTETTMLIRFRSFGGDVFRIQSLGLRMHVLGYRNNEESTCNIKWIMTLRLGFYKGL